MSVLRSVGPIIRIEKWHLKDEEVNLLWCSVVASYQLVQCFIP